MVKQPHYILCLFFFPHLLLSGNGVGDFCIYVKNN